MTNFLKIYKVYKMYLAFTVKYNKSKLDFRGSYVAYFVKILRFINTTVIL